MESLPNINPINEVRSFVDIMYTKLIVPWINKLDLEEVIKYKIYD